MLLMLAIIFLFVVIGLFIPQFGSRERGLVAVVAGMMTLVYIVFSNRVL